MDLCLEQQCQEGNRKHTRKEKVRLACLTATHLNVSEVSSPSGGSIKHVAGMKN